MSGDGLDLVADNRKWLRLHEHNKYQAEAARRITVLLDEVERLRAERDTAREECGYEKRMRAFVSEERDRFIDAKRRAEAERDRWKHAYEMADPLLTERDDLAATVDRVRAALAGHPRCEKYAGDDPITCGWKKAVLDVQAAIERTDS